MPEILTERLSVRLSELLHTNIDCIRDVIESDDKDYDDVISMEIMFNLKEYFDAKKA